MMKRVIRIADDIRSRAAQRRIQRSSKRRELTHREAEEMIPRYLAHQLSEQEMFRFLRHLRHCHRCYEELETSYMINRTLYYLDQDEDEDMTFNLKFELLHDMQRRLRQISLYHVMQKFRTAFLMFAAAAGILVLLDAYGIFQLSLYL